MSDTSLTSISGLWHERGERELFAGLDLAINAGEIIQIRGPNGHGKSTLLRVLAGLIRPDRGEQRWQGATFRSWEDEAIAPIAWLGEQLGWAHHHSVRHNWRYLRALRGLPIESTDVWIDETWWQRRFGDLSTGQRKRTALAFVEASKADLWLLDEPLSGLDVAMSAEWQRRMQHAANRGTGIVIVSHEPLDHCESRAFDWNTAI